MRYPGGPGMYFHIGSDVTAGGEVFTYEDLVAAARMVAWHYTIGKPGQHYPPGDMFRSVLDAMGRADPGNLARLCRAFPLHGALMRGVRNDDPEIRSMILNLIKYHSSEGWTEPTEPAAITAPPKVNPAHHTDTCDHFVSDGEWDCSCHESETS